MNLGKAYSQLFDLQDVLYRATLDDSTPAKDKAACARVWEALEERKRVMRGRPLPGSLRPQPPQPKRKATPQSLTPPDTSHTPI